MLIKIQSFIIAIYLLIAGLSYADKTVKVECDIDFAVTEFSPGESGTFEIRCKNIGIPFKGESPHNVDYSFFKTVDGERVYLDFTCAVDEGNSLNLFVVKNAEEFIINGNFTLDEDAEKGVYSVEIKVYGCEHIFENVFTVN